MVVKEYDSYGSSNSRKAGGPTKVCKACKLGDPLRVVSFSTLVYFGTLVYQSVARVGGAPK